MQVQRNAQELLRFRNKACIINKKYCLLDTDFPKCVRDRDAEWFSLIHCLSTLISLVSCVVIDRSLYIKTK